MKFRARHLKVKTIFLIYICTFLVAVGLSAVIAIFFSQTVKQTSDEFGKDYDAYYMMIPANRDLDFWQSVYDGAYETAKEKNIYVELMGANLNKEYTNEELMEIAIASAPDGIIVAGDESETMTDLINRATAENIPVVTVYSDSPLSKRCAFVGVGSYNLGREYGKQIVKIANERENNDTLSSTKMNKKINVITLVSDNQDNTDQSIVFSGIQNMVDTSDTGNTQINLSMVHVDERNPFATEEEIHDLFRQEEIPDVIVCLNEKNTACVYQAVVDSNKVGQVSILGYYDSETILNAISRSVIYATVSADTKQMGMYCVNALAEYNETGNTSQYMLTDITFIDSLNVSEYLDDESKEEE